MRNASLIRAIYSIVNHLEGLFPERSFTPDGHMVSAIGEAWAAWIYDLDLLPQSAERHDARARDGRLVQIKATQGRSVGLSSRPDHFLVLQIDDAGEAKEIYNGPGDRAWARAGRRQKNGQRSIGISKLLSLQGQVEDGSPLPVCRRPPGWQGPSGGH